MQPTDAKLALEVVRRTGDRELEGRLMAAFALTKGLRLLCPYIIGPGGEPIGVGQPIDVFVGKDPPEGYTFSLRDRTYPPSRSGDRAATRKRGRPRREYLPSREVEEWLVRAWEDVWSYVGERVLGLPRGRSGFHGIDSQIVHVLLVPPGTTVSAPPLWMESVTIEGGTESRGRRQAIRQLLSRAPATVSVAELMVIPAGRGIARMDRWRSGPIGLRRDGLGARPSSVCTLAEREVQRLAGRKLRFDPSQGPIRLACMLLREGHGDLPKAKIEEVVRVIYSLAHSPKRARDYSSERRVVLRHLAGAKRQVAAAGREPPE